MNFKSLLYLCLVFSVCVKYNGNFPRVNSLFWYNKLMCYRHQTMTTWSQTEKYIAAWILRIRNRKIYAPGRPTFFTLHHLTILEAHTCPTKNISYKNCTQLDSLPSKILHKIYMWHAIVVHCNKLKPFLVRFTQHHPVLSASMSDKLKYAPFDYYTN